MCRFIAYLGEPIILHDVLYKPEHSLIKQSFHAKEMDEPLNGDGFGIGWYNLDIDDNPAVFKSIQPAWNNLNLEMISSKIKSGCLLAHVRAANKGSVSYFNTHPFVFKNYIFMHNGIIGGFENIRREIQTSLSDEVYSWVKGQTDSELFFGLFLEFLKKEKKPLNTENCRHFFQKAIEYILKLKSKYKVSNTITLVNSVISNGKEMYIFRYVSNDKAQPNSLYYSKGHHLICNNGTYQMKSTEEKPKAILVVSEMLNQDHDGWLEVPTNHMLAIQQNLKTSLHEIKLHA